MDSFTETLAHLNRSKRLKTGERPKGWTGNSPYYTPRFAEEIKEHLDVLLANPDKEIAFDSRKLRMKRETVFQRVYQGWRYLSEKEDPDGKYAALRDHISIKRKGTLIILSREKGPKCGEMKGEIVDANKSKWREDLVNYVESECETMPPYSRTDLILTDVDLDWLTAYLGTLDEVIATIAIHQSGFKVVKNPTLARKIKAEREKGM